MIRWQTLSTSMVTLAARVVTILAVLVINGVAKRHMTSDEFGLWTILYLMNLLSNAFDFGFSFTLGNRLAALMARGDEAEEERRQTFLSVFFLELCIAIGGMLIIWLVFPHVPWAHWFKVTDAHLIAEIEGPMRWLLMVIFCTLPIALMWTVFFAYREIRLASTLAMSGSLLQIVAFVWGMYRANFVATLFAYFGFWVLFGTVLTIYVFVHRRWRFGLLPPARILEILHPLARVSMHSFLNSLVAVISTILGPIVSGYVGGLSLAGDFSLVRQLFSSLTTGHLAILAPLGPRLTTDAHLGDWAAIHRRVRITLVLIWPVIFLGAGPLIWWFHPLLLRLWTGHPQQVYTTAFLLLLWAATVGFSNTFSLFLNSLGLVKMQAALSIALMLPTMVLPIYLGRSYGMNGVALAFVILAIPSALVLPFYTRRALRRRIIRI